MMNQSTLYVFLAISGFVLMFVALFYPRKKEKEEQAKSDLATLLEQLDWPGVRRFIFKELRGWIALALLATAFSYRVYRQKLQSYLCSEHRSSFLLPPV